MERAEKIKGVISRKSSSFAEASSSGIAPPSLTPVAVNEFSTEEQYYILKKGSVINGRFLPLWDESPIVKTSDDDFEDPDGQPTLSEAQLEHNPIWFRYPYPRTPSSSRRLIPEDIHQHVVTDCSLCASVSVCLERDNRLGSNLARACLFPSSLDGDAVDQFSGRFDLKLFFNGCWRRITIDDKLPRSASIQRLVCMSCLTLNTVGNVGFEFIWPSILEKGYMKFMGGYDFPGSNSNIDLHALTGWIPEHIDIHSPHFVRERTWTRLKQGFDKGDCLITLGTGKRDNLSWQGNSLLCTHNYAVTDVFEDGMEREMVVLDSWYEALEEEECPESSRSLRIPWPDVIDMFEGIHVNWNPATWASSLTFHGIWKRDVKTASTQSKQIRLMYDSSRSTGVELDIGVLLSRHTDDTRRTHDYISLKVQEEDEDCRDRQLSQQISTQGEYTNSLHIFEKARLPSLSSSGSLLIYCSYESVVADTGFTLTAYAPTGLQISWDERVSRPPYVVQTEGRLTAKSAGGNASHPTFMYNPQYHLKLFPPKRGDPRARSAITMSLKTTRGLLVNITAAWSQGERIDQLSQSNVAASSGAYTYGTAHLVNCLPPGDYTVIVSAFEPRYTGPFTLRVESENVAEISPIPQEGAGMYATIVRGSWNVKSAGGSPSFRRYGTNPMYSFSPKVTTRIKARLQLVKPSASAALNLTIYRADDIGDFSRHVATSGPYDDALSGVSTPETTLQPGTYVLVPSTYNPGILSAFQMHVYASAPDLIFETVGSG